MRAALAILGISLAWGLQSPALAGPELTFEQRVEAQAAIERVYHRHQIGDPRPFETAVPRELLEAKVRRLLELGTTRPVTREALAAGVRRLRARTRMPERLAELFDALHQDPRLIEECLARPIALLAEPSIVAPGSVSAAEPRASPGGADSCTPDAWTPMSATLAPSPRRSAASVWTGNVFVVWGGADGSGSALGDGARYDPVLDAWFPVTATGAPAARSNHLAVWTGSEMLVWGGEAAAGTLATGGRYDPIADAWTTITAVGAPAPRSRATALWTGARMIVWGGYAGDGTPCADRTLRDGGQYEPQADAWIPTALPPILGREGHTAVWTGAEMIVFGGRQSFDMGHGSCGALSLSDGAIYLPLSDTWHPMNPVGGPGNRSDHVATWTGQEMVVWGGTGGPSGSRYDPGSDAWRPVSTVGAPPADWKVASDWTGSRMIVWGAGTASGGLYDPAADAWGSMTVSAAPEGRGDAEAAWNGAEFLVWGGATNAGVFGDGGVYSPGDPDDDGDGVCLAADNCPWAPNPAQGDGDGDARGDACDNCPSTPNPSQGDTDLDDAGDACDLCPLDPQDDADGDGSCADVDDCPGAFNPRQRDADGDAFGDACDACPSTPNPSQEDTDLDGAGDVCDCQPLDGGDRAPAEVATLSLDRSGGSALLTWSVVGEADAYAITRGNLESKAAQQYGSCLAPVLAGTSFSDPDIPPLGGGFFYLVHAQNFDCGSGTLGTDSNEIPRVNASAGACAETTVLDLHPIGETTVFGTRIGTLANVSSSNDLEESVTEVLSTGGNPSLRYSQLDHRWSFSLPAGSRVELHVEGHALGENFRLQFSSDGIQFFDAGLPPLPLTGDPNGDTAGVLPAALNGTVSIRLVDESHAPGEQGLSTTFVDEIWIRVVP